MPKTMAVGVLRKGENRSTCYELKLTEEGMGRGGRRRRGGEEEEVMVVTQHMAARRGQVTQCSPSPLYSASHVMARGRTLASLGDHSGHESTCSSCPTILGHSMT